MACSLDVIDRVHSMKNSGAENQEQGKTGDWNKKPPCPEGCGKSQGTDIKKPPFPEAFYEITTWMKATLGGGGACEVSRP
jgi:hypothetical protein